MRQGRLIDNEDVERAGKGCDVAGRHAWQLAKHCRGIIKQLKTVVATLTSSKKMLDLKVLSYK